MIISASMEDYSANKLQSQIDWIARLVAFDTTSRNSNLALIENVESYLDDLGIPHHRVSSPDGRKANLYSIIGPQVPGGVVLSGHTDVVPVDGQIWDTDPWILTEKNGKLYGRGSCDMKGFLAIALSLIPEMLSAGLQRPIILALSYDEEVGCVGAPAMISEIRENVPMPSAVIVGEPTSMKVVDGHKGICAFRTMVKGYTTHSSQTDHGVSAVEIAGRLITRLNAMREGSAACVDPDNPFDPPYSTVTVNVINGGTQWNVMAAECFFEWDMRTIPGDSPESIVAEFEAYARDVEAEMKTRAPSCFIKTEQSISAPHFSAEEGSTAAKLAKSITGHTHTEAVSYAAEAGQFQEAGFSAVVCGPGSIDQAHKANEFISVGEVAKGTQFVRELIDRLADDRN